MSEEEIQVSEQEVEAPAVSGGPISEAPIPEVDRAAIREKIFNDPELPLEDFERARKDEKFSEALIDAYLEEEKESIAAKTSEEPPPPTETTETAPPEKAGGHKLSTYRRKQMKIDRLTRENYELRQRLTTQESGPGAQVKTPAEAAPAEPKTDPRPDGSVYAKSGKTYEEFTEDLAAWSARQAVQAAIQQDHTEREKEQKERTQAQEKKDWEEFQATRERHWAEQVFRGREKHEDFDELVFEQGFANNEVVINAIMDSDVGDELAYYLATNPEDSEALVMMPPISALRAIGRLEARFIAPNGSGKKSGEVKTPAGTQLKEPLKIPPEPIKPLRGVAAPNVRDYAYFSNPEVSSAQEYEEARRTRKLQ